MIPRSALPTVVLAGESVNARQSLVTKLQIILRSQSLSFDFRCPSSPLALQDMPTQAQFFLWKKPALALASIGQEDWRDQLHAMNLPYQTLHADNGQALQQVVFALLNGQNNALSRPEVTSKWQGLCECCADPGCEQRLFGRLLQDRS
ncbi:MAG: hypothetical protein ACKO69_04440 [Limnohabitans sp.]